MAGPPSQDTCFICGTSIPFTEALLQEQEQYKVCRDVDCRRVLKSKEQLSPHLYQVQLDFQRRLILERREKQHQQRLHREAVERAEQAQDQTLLREALARRPGLEEKAVSVLVIPSGLSEPVPVPEARSAQYRAHLESLFDEAQRYGSVDEVPMDQHFDAHDRLRQSEQRLSQHPPLQRISDHLCGLCKGGCCSTGREHAFLSVVTVRRMLDASPELTKDDIVQTYLQHLPHESIADACINQTGAGCALPRHLRSDVCNGYFCDSLRRFQRDWPTIDKQSEVFVIRRANTNWNRFESEGPNSVQEVVWISPAAFEGPADVSK